MSRSSFPNGQAAQQHCDTQSSSTRRDFEAHELTRDFTTTVTALKSRLNDNTTVISPGPMDLVSKVDETESRLRSERNTTPSTVGEQNQKLNNLYIKIGRLCEENDTLKENIAALKDRERKKEELCETCKVKETEIAELQEQLGPVGESSEENKDIGPWMKKCELVLSVQTNE